METAFLPATLEERQEVLLYCVKCIEKKAMRLSSLMKPDMDADDIISEVRCRVWKAMVRKEYLKMSKSELTKIGYVTAQRHIAQLVRSKLSRKLSTRLSLHNPTVFGTLSILAKGNFYSMSATRAVLLNEAIRDEAIGMVGVACYEVLIRGSKFDWNILTEDLCYGQHSVMCDLDYSHSKMMRMVSVLGKRVAKCLREDSGYYEEETVPTRIDGVWVQYREVLSQ